MLERLQTPFEILHHILDQKLVNVGSLRQYNLPILTVC